MTSTTFKIVKDSKYQECMIFKIILIETTLYLDRRDGAVVNSH